MFIFTHAPVMSIYDSYNFKYNRANFVNLVNDEILYYDDRNVRIIFHGHKHVDLAFKDIEYDDIDSWGSTHSLELETYAFRTYQTTPDYYLSSNSI